MGINRYTGSGMSPEAAEFFFNALYPQIVRKYGQERVDAELGLRRSGSVAAPLRDPLGALGSGFFGGGGRDERQGAQAGLGATGELGMSIGRQASFAAGEISTALYGRVDQARYYSALRTARNVWVKRSGGVENRPGTKFITDLPLGTSAGRVIQFAYSVGQQYGIVFATDGIYFTKNGAIITETADTVTGATSASPGVFTAALHGFSVGDLVEMENLGGITQVNGRTFRVGTVPSANTFTLQYADRSTAVDTSSFGTYTSGGTASRLYRISNPYLLADLGDIKFTQANDVLVFTHPDYAPRKLVRTTDTSWALTTIEFYPDLDYVPGLAAALNNRAARSSAGTIQHRYKVTSINPTTGEESIAALESYTDATSGGGPFDRTLSAISAANPGVVTTTGNHGYVIGDVVVIFTSSSWAFSGEYLQITAVTPTTFSIGIDTTGNAYGGAGFCHRPYLACASAAPTSAAPIEIFAETNAGLSGNARKFVIYKELSGVFGFIGIVDLPESFATSNGTFSFKDIGVTPDTSDTPPDAFVTVSGSGVGSTFVVEDPMFSTSGNYPSSGAFYQQRLFFARTTNNPTRVWGSRTGFPFNFLKPQISTSDSPIQFDVSGNQTNAIRHLLDIQRLAILTSGEEKAANGSGDNFTVTPTSIGLQGYSNNGSSSCAPVIANSVCVYVDRGGSIIRTLAFDSIGGFDGDDITAWSNHLFDGHEIIQLAYAQCPNSIIWALRDDGVLLSCTFNPKQQMVAWTRHETTDPITSICTIKEGSEDVLYMIVKRSVADVPWSSSAADVYYLERMATRLISSTTDIRDAVFADSSLTYDGRNTGSITGTLSGASYSAGESLTLTFSSATASSSDVGKSYFLWNSTETAIVKCLVTAYTDTTHVTVQPDRDVPASLQATATTIWALAITSASGAWHLEGERVSVFADGCVVASPNNSAYSVLTVTNGAVTLPEAFAVVTVGLPYISDVQTLNIDVPQGGGLIDTNKLVNQVVLFVENSRGMWVGCKPPTSDTTAPLEDLREVQERGNADSYDSPPVLITDAKDTPIPGTWNNNGRVFVRQVDPVPMSILSIAPGGYVG